MYQNNDLSYDPNEIIIYLRKSRSDDPLLSVEDVLLKHETILNEFAEKYLDISIPEENKYREIVSGETIDDRPEFQKVLKLIESPKYKAIMVVEVQRLSRGDLEDAGRLMKLLRFTNTAIITPQKTYNLHDEYDRDIFERELKRGNEYLEYSKKIMNRGKLLSVQQGNFIGSIPPYGYDRITILEGKRKCHTLKENKEQADVVRMIFDMYVNQDMGRTSICYRLDELGIKAPKGEHWSPSAIKDTLENVHYIGKIKWNWRKKIAVVEDGEIIKTRPKSKNGDYLIYDGKHPAIISEELFYAAQNKQMKKHRSKAKTKVRNPLAGLLYCQCGKAMSLRTYKRNGVERCSARLLCNNQNYCGTSSCLYSEMVEQVRFILEEHIRDFEIRIKNDDNATKALHENLIKRLELKMSELERKEISQWEKYSEEGMPKHIFEKLNEKVIREKEETQQALAIAYESTPRPIDYQNKLLHFKSALEALDNPNISAAQKNKLLKTCIERIDYKRAKTIRITDPLNPKHSGWNSAPIELTVKLHL